MTKILIIDDDPISLNVCNRFLESQYFTMMVDDIPKAKSILLFEKIDLLICDFWLKDSNIEDLLDWRNATSLNVPVIGMSKYQPRAEMKTAVAKGLFDFIPKPLDRNQLLKCVELALSFSSTTAAPSDGPKPGDQKKLAVLNYSSMLRLLGADVEMMTKMMHSFSTELKHTRAILQEKLTVSDLKPHHQDIVALTHRLHGSAIYAGAEEVAQTCFDIQNSITRGEQIQTSDLKMLISRIENLEKKVQLLLEKNIPSKTV